MSVYKIDKAKHNISQKYLIEFIPMIIAIDSQNIVYCVNQTADKIEKISYSGTITKHNKIIRATYDYKIGEIKVDNNNIFVCTNGHLKITNMIDTKDAIHSISGKFLAISTFDGALYYLTNEGGLRKIHDLVSIQQRLSKLEIDYRKLINSSSTLTVIIMGRLFNVHSDILSCRAPSLLYYVTLYVHELRF